MEAEEYLQGVLAERGLWESGDLLGAEVTQRFGELVKAAASPIDDVRGTADYHAALAGRDGPADPHLDVERLQQADQERGMRVTFTANGKPVEADDVWEGESLLYVLRERVGLPGSKNACEQGECGSCTVYLDGTPVCSCLVAARCRAARSAPSRA